MLRQILVLTAALALHSTAILLVGSVDQERPRVHVATPRAPRLARCQADTPPAAARAEPAAAPPPTAITDVDLATGVLAIDPTHRFVMRSLFDKVLQAPMGLAHSARIVPAMCDGKPDGVKLYQVRRGGLADRLGFENGDTLQAINHVSVASPDQALEAYAVVSRGTNFELQVRRHGEPLTLHVAVVGVTNPMLDASIVRSDATHAFVGRPFLDLALADPALLANGARIVPAFRDGKPEGFKLYAIQPGSVPARLGFENGDTVTTINGRSLAAAVEAPDSLALLGAAPAVDIGLIRHGQALALAFKIGD